MKNLIAGVFVLLFSVTAFPFSALGAPDYGTELPVSWSSAPGKMGLWRTAWSPDGEWIAVTCKSGGVYEIFVVPSQGGAPENLTGEIIKSCAIPQFASDSGEVVFTHYATDENNMLVFVIEAIALSSGERRELAKGFGGALSKDGKQVVFQSVSSSTSPMELIVGNLEEGSTKVLVSNSPKIVIDYGHSCFSPSGEHVVTTLIQDGSSSLSSHKLFKIPVSGGAPARVTADEMGEEWYPVYSPLGTRLMYTRFVYGKDRNDRTTQVYIFDTTTGKTLPLIPDAEQSTWCGSWSPDGRKVCYVLETDTGSKLYVKDVEPEKTDDKQLNVASGKPSGFELKGNFPNPFNPSTTISLSVQETRQVTIEIYNLAGQKVDTVMDAVLRAGEHALAWNADRFSAGIYLCTVKSGSISKSIRMTLVK